MAFNQIPGFKTGYVASRYSSMDERSIGKLTDMNRLSALGRNLEPAKYDKEIITLYTQTATYSSDLQQMLAEAKPYLIPKGAPDYWSWEVSTVYQFPRIIGVPDATANNAKPGVDGQEFEFILDKEDFFADQVITSDKRYAPEFTIVADAVPAQGGFLYRATLNSLTAASDFVDKKWLAEGRPYQLIRSVSGEFDQDGPGLGRMGDRIKLYESLGAGASRKHVVTGWAEEMGVPQGQELTVYGKMQLNEVGKPMKLLSTSWEPTIERMLKDDLLKEGMQAAIWAKGGSSRSRGSKQEVRKISPGLYWRMRNNGNLIQYPKGAFSINLLRNTFGDLFYRRVAMGQRKVKLYTNEAGFNVFDQAVKKDALGSGISLMDNGQGNGFITGAGQSRSFNFGFSSVTTRETGLIELVHLAELDQPETPAEFGQNKRSTPIFLVFDVTPGASGMQENIRRVSRAGTPALRWSYVDGQMSHLGPQASQGHNAGSSFDGYEINMKTRWDIFIEDMSRCVMIEELPLY